MPEPTRTEVSRASMKWLAAPDEIAERIAFSASSKASFTTGHISFQAVEKTVGPYIASNQIRTFDGATQLFLEIRTIPAYGHTPGQTFYALESDGEKVVFLGDTIHAPDVQFDAPSITIKFDIDQKLAANQRERAFSDAAKNGYLVAFAHMYFPGVGHSGERWKSLSVDPGALHK